MKRMIFLFVVLTMLLPAVSNAYMINYLTGPYSPSSAYAGEFTGSMAIFYSLSQTHASWNGAEASTSLSLGQTAISGSGQVTATYAGDAAGSSIGVAFTILGEQIPYNLSTSLSIGPEYRDMFHNNYVVLAISDIQSYLTTGVVYLDHVLPASGLISPYDLGQDEAFFLIAGAIEVKDPNQIPSPPVSASYHFSFDLNPSSQVPEPPVIWLQVIAIIAFVATLHRRRIHGAI